MSIRSWLRHLVLGRELAEDFDDVLKMKQNGGFKCYCPGCRDILNYNAKTREQSGMNGEWVRYNCARCGHVSRWNMDAPVPLLRNG